MKKKLCTKLTLSRETLSVLDPGQVSEANGGVRTLNGTCPGNTCLTCQVVSICQAC